MGEVYVSVDIEAAGPVPGTYSMLSLGACIAGDATRTFYAELRPINDRTDPAAMEVVGRPLQDFLQKGRDPTEVMLAFRDWLASVARDNSPVFIGFNAAFDWSFVNWYFHTYVGVNPFGFGAVDIKSFYMGMTGCSWADTRSSRIPSALKGRAQHTHNALDDAIEQGEMFRRMWERIHQR